jgi:arabinofuranosyltransferase
MKKYIWQWTPRLPSPMLVLSIVAFILYALYFDNGPYSIYDDSFISFRYARKLAHGHGLVFNPGERVEGYTNFLWTVLMAGAIGLGADVIAASKMVAMAAGAATLWLVFLLGRQELGDVWPGVLLAGMVAVTASFARYAVSGFEMLLFGMLILLSLYLYLRALRADRLPLTAAVALALVAMTRPEGMMVYGVLTLHYFILLWRSPAPGQVRLAYLGSWLAGFGLVYAPYFAWRYAYYGYLLPNTFYTKVGGPGLAQFGRGLRYLQEMLLLVSPQAVLCLALGIFWSGRRSSQILLYSLIGIYLSYLVVVGGDQQAFFGPRFLLPLWPLIYILGVGGTLGLAARLDRRRQRLLWTGVLGALVCIFSLWASLERQGYLGLQHTMHRGWITLGHWLAARAQSDDTLAVDAAGIIPFYTDLYTIDMFGLNDLHIAHLDMEIGQGLPGHEKFDPVYVLSRRPTYIAAWLDPNGHPLYFYSGPPSIAAQLETDYELWAVALMRLPVGGDETPVVIDPTYTSDLHERGYIYGLFRRKNRGQVKQ